MIFVLILIGLIILFTWDFFIIYAETEIPIFSVGDQWSYGWFNGRYTNNTEVGGHMMTITVDRMEDYEGVPCYVCIQEYQPWEYENHTNIFWITSDWVILRTEIFDVYPFGESRITFIYDQGMKLYDFPLSVGKEWSGRSYRTIEQTFYNFTTGEEEIWTGGTDYIDWFRRVVATDNITIPAGTFDTYVVEMVGGESTMGLEEGYNYFSLDARNNVKFESPSPSGGGYILTSFKLFSQENGSLNLPLIIILPVTMGILGIVFLIYNRRYQEIELK